MQARAISIALWALMLIAFVQICQAEADINLERRREGGRSGGRGQGSRGQGSHDGSHGGGSHISGSHGQGSHAGGNHAPEGYGGGSHAHGSHVPKVKPTRTRTPKLPGTGNIKMAVPHNTKQKPGLKLASGLRQGYQGHFQQKIDEPPLIPGSSSGSNDSIISLHSGVPHAVPSITKSQKPQTSPTNSSQPKSTPTTTKSRLNKSGLPKDFTRTAFSGHKYPLSMTGHTPVNPDDWEPYKKCMETLPHNNWDGGNLAHTTKRISYCYSEANKSWRTSAASASKAGAPWPSWNPYANPSLTSKTKSWLTYSSKSKSSKNSVNRSYESCILEDGKCLSSMNSWMKHHPGQTSDPDPPLTLATRGVGLPEGNEDTVTTVGGPEPARTEARSVETVELPARQT